MRRETIEALIKCFNTHEEERTVPIVTHYLDKDLKECSETIIIPEKENKCNPN